MAKQNFLSGGYYGKLGQTVGQRWKNTRTIRQYVVPKDPKTTAQLEQRSKFAAAIPYAQVGMSTNWSNNYFSSTTQTQWNGRVQAALQLLKTYSTFLSRVPLIPVDKTPDYVIDSLIMTYDAQNNTITFVCTTALPSVARSYSVLITENPTTENPDEVFLFQAYSTASDPNVITTATITNWTFSQDIAVRICSNDDTENDNGTILSPEITPTYKSKTISEFVPEFSDIYVTDDTITLQLTNAYIEGTATFTFSAMNAISNVAIISPNVTFSSYENNNDTMQLTFTQTDYTENTKLAFGDNCFITIGYFTIETDDTIYIASSTTLTCKSSSDTERTSTLTFASSSFSSDTLYLLWSHDNAANISNPQTITCNSTVNNFSYGTAVHTITDFDNSSTASTIIIALKPQFIDVDYIADNEELADVENALLSFGTVTTDTPAYIEPFSVVFNGITYTINPTGNVSLPSIDWNYTLDPEFDNEPEDALQFNLSTITPYLFGNLSSLSLNLVYNTSNTGIYEETLEDSDTTYASTDNVTITPEYTAGDYSGYIDLEGSAPALLGNAVSIPKFSTSTNGTTITYTKQVVPYMNEIQEYVSLLDIEDTGNGIPTINVASTGKFTFSDLYNKKFYIPTGSEPEATDGTYMDFTAKLTITYTSSSKASNEVISFQMALQPQSVSEGKVLKSGTLSSFFLADNITDPDNIKTATLAIYNNDNEEEGYTKVCTISTNLGDLIIGLPNNGTDPLISFSLTVNNA